MKKSVIDKPISITCVALIVAFVALVIVKPDATINAVNVIFDYATAIFGVPILWFVFIGLFVCLYLAFGKYGKIKLGDGKPEYSLFSYIAMMMCAALAATAVYYSFVEWSFYLAEPSFGLEPYSREAAEYALPYAFFHWGFAVQVVFVLLGVCMAYGFYVKKVPHLRVSAICGEMMGNYKYKKPLGKIIDALTILSIIGGVGAVLGFLPLVMVMYFLIAMLEDCGYMARVSVVLDPIFKKVGLSGKSVIPFVIGTGCAIPGVMACRTIRNERERKATAMLTPFMPCGAKLPVIALFAGVFFHDASWVGTLMYFAGILLIFLGALLIGKITGYKNRKSFFLIELPQYKIPSLKRATLAMLSRGKAYIVKAGTIILLCNTLVQLMQNFTWQFTLVEEGMESTSILASIASPIAVLLIPLGFGVWQLAAAAVTGFIAKENVVGTLAVVYGITNFINVDDLVLTHGADQVAAIFGLSQAAALAYLMFNLFTPPCFAAIGAMNSEIRDKKWLLGGVGLQFATGYVVAFLVYQIGTLVTTGTFGQGFVPGLIAVLAIVMVFVLLIHRTNRQLSRDYALNAGD